MNLTFSTLQTALSADGILQITLNRPEKLNALNRQLLTELKMLLTEIKPEKKVKAVLITGSGDKAFCAGADIREIQAISPQQGMEFAEFGQSVFRALETLGKPSVAAINGYAFGGGCELAMSATLRIAADTAQFGQPEIKLGLIPGYGGTQRLPRLIGKGRALDLCLTGRTIKAADAYAWGLVNEIVAKDQLLTRANALLHELLALPQVAITNIINAIDHGYDLSLDEALNLEAVCFGLTCASKDKQIGVTAFIEKQKAQFTGE